MTATDPRALCIIGVAQHTTPPPGPAPEPLDSWEQVARAAAEDAGAPDALGASGSLQIVYCQSWQYDDPTARLADRIGAAPGHRFYSGIGGTTPQLMLGDTAVAMQAGEYDLALLVSAEALATKRAAKRNGEKLQWSHKETVRSPYPWEPPPAVELNHEVFQAWETFPLWDTARRAARGTSLEDYDRANAEMMSGLSQVAARNPHAWDQTALTAADIGDPVGRNRYIGWPYTKREVSVMDVDMAAALLVCTTERADSLGIAADKRIYLNSSAYAEDPAGIAERADLARSAAMAVASKAALDAAGVTTADLTLLDIYSCFPSSVNLACDALGIDPLDPRGLTVTGGLPYAGGAASAYLMHAIATAVQMLRTQAGTALITGVGMHLQKHVFAVYSNRPGFTATPTADLQAAVEAQQARRPLVDSYDGAATVAAYTVAHDRDNQPTVGLVVLDVPEGRTLARVHDGGLLADAESRELVGQTVTVTTDGTKNEAKW
ncbi:MAG: acetyl-CoA synthetase [Frankiaceae bacterium]|nr:acetyl-CoA synthetase [Frankiaceae bacterium]